MPRRKSKSKLYHNPDNKIGYDIMNNFSTVTDLTQDFVRGMMDTNYQMELEAAKLRKRREDQEKLAEAERKYREKIEKESAAVKAAVRPEDTVDNPLVRGLAKTIKFILNPIGAITGLDDFVKTAAVTMPIAHAHVVNKDIPNMPSDYGMDDFFKDQWNSFFGEMNHLLAEDARGYQVRALLDKQLILAYQLSLDELDEIESINVRLNDLRLIDTTGFNQQLMHNLKTQIDLLTFRKYQLKESYESKANQRQLLEELTKYGSKYIPIPLDILNAAGRAIDWAMQGSGFLGGAMDWAFGKTTAFHDELNDARRYLYNIGDWSVPITEKQKQLKLALNEYDNLNKSWNEIIKENEEDWKKHQAKTSAFFKAREQLAGTDFFDPDTYLFKMPGIWGGSSSSYMKQIPAMAVGLAASVLSGGAATPEAAALILGSGGASSFLMQRGAGISENNAEVALATVEKIKDRTGLSEKDIQDILSGKLRDLAKLRKVTENIKNAENLFNLDMAATTWDAAIDAALTTVPVGTMAKAGKFVRGSKLVQELSKNPIMKKIIESKMGSAAASGFEWGSTAGPGAGAVGAFLNSTVGLGTKEATKKLGLFVMPKISGTKFGTLTREIGKRAKALSQSLPRLNSSELDEAAKMYRGLNAKYARGIGGKLIKSGISEGIEEGKLHVNAEAFKNDTLGNDLKSVFDIGVTDTLNGIKMGAYVLGIPIDGIGLINIRDKQLLQEIKGGMLGGWGHTASLSVLSETAPYIQERRATDIVLQHVLADKLESQAKFNQYKTWLKSGLLRPSMGQVNQAFDRLRTINEDKKKATGEYGIDPGMIDESEKKYFRLLGIAKDPLTRAHALAQGIDAKGSWWKSNNEYHEFVAGLGVALDKIDEKRENFNESLNNLKAVLQEVEKKLRTYLDDRNQENLLEYLQDQYNNGVSDFEALLDYFNDAETELNSDMSYTKSVAMLAALMKYRDYVRTGLEALKNNPDARVRRGLKKQLDSLDKEIKGFVDLHKQILKFSGIDVGDGFQINPNSNQDINTLLDVEDHLVMHEEEHEMLRDAYEEFLKNRDEYESSLLAYEDFYGKGERVDDQGKPVTATEGEERWEPRTDLKHYKVTGGTAKKTLAEIRKVAKDDDDFETLIETVYGEKLEIDRANEANGWKQPELNVAQPRPVYDANGNWIRVPMENGIPMRELAENEAVDANGFLYELPDAGIKDPLQEALKPKRSREEVDAAAKALFAETFFNITGMPLPLTAEGFNEMMILRRMQYLIDKGATSSSVPPLPPAPPVPPTPPSTPINPIQDEDPAEDPQQETLDMLQKKYELDKKDVLNNDEYFTTNQDYFILVNGSPTRMSRVHNVKPEPYSHPNKEKDIDELYSTLSKYSYDLILQWFENLKQQNEDLYKSLIPYYSYIKDNNLGFFNNPNLEQKVEYDITIKHIAQAYYDFGTSESPSIKNGNIVDELGRNFFGSPVWYEKSDTQEGIIELFDSINEYTNRSYRDLFENDIDSFISTINGLRKLYEYYTKDPKDDGLGWKISTLPLTWKANFNNTGWVAGQTDMIGVDKNGDIHIIDFKTSMHTFESRRIPNIELTTAYDTDLNILNEEDFANDKLSKKARNLLRVIKSDSGAKNITLLWNPQIGRAVVVDKHRSFYELPNQNRGQVLSSYLDYSNLLTSYALMIQIETGGTVKSIEILPFFCDYDFLHKNVIYKIQVLLRIPLMFSKQMLDILTGVSNPTSTRVQQLQDQIADAYTLLRSIADEISSKFTDEIFLTLSEEGKFIFADYANAIDNIEVPVTEDVERLESILSEINDLIDQRQDIINRLNLDYVAEKAKLANAAELRQKTELVEQHLLEEPAGEAVDTVRAENKNKSRGNQSRTNLNYKLVLADRSLRMATSAPDFILASDITIYSDGNQVFADITYNGQTFKRIAIDTTYNGQMFPNGKKLLDEVKRLESIKKPGQRIVPVKSTMTRTAGAIELAIDSNRKLTYVPISDTDLFSNEDIYDVEFSLAYGRMGFVNQQRTLVTFDGNPSNRKVIYTWFDVRKAPVEGTLIYLKHVRKDELNRDSIIPVAIDRVKLKEGDINFILQMLENPDFLDKEYFSSETGEAINTHVTGRQLINMLIPVVDDVRDVDSHIHILRDIRNPFIIRLVNRENLATGSQGLGTFDISTEDGRNRFVSVLKTLSIEERHDVLSTRLGTDTNALLPFNGLRKFFIEQHNLGRNITSLNISESLQFDINDFRTVTSKSGVLRSGLNGLGYYIKHNLFNTQYKEMGSCNVEIQEVTLEDSGTPEIQDSGALETPQMPTRSEILVGIDDSEIDTLLSSLLKQMSDRDKNKKPLKESEARRKIRRILGDNVPIKFEDDFLKVASGAAHVVGNCKTDCIILSGYAWNGVEYHEAFHRIFELLVPENKRDFIYLKIAKRLGLNLYNKDGSENINAFRICAEYAADAYMDHMKRNIDDVKHPFLAKIFNKIHDWVALFVHFRDRDLYKIFIAVNSGKFKNIQPSEKLIERFNRLYKELHAKIHGVDFEHIVNRAMYDKLKETVKFCIIQGLNVDRSGRNIQEIGKHIDKDTFKAGIDKMMEKGIDILGQKEGIIPTVGQLAMKEIYDNFDTETLRDDIANSISIISTDFIKIREKENVETAQSGDVTGSSIGEHTRASYEFSRFEKTSSRVRFMFATIPDMKYVNVVTEENGVKRIVKRPVLALNEFGLPLFVPVAATFNEVLNYFHDVDTVQELLDRMEKLSKEDAMFRILYSVIKKMYSKIYEEKDGMLVKNADREALISLLMNVIRSNKHNFDIARSKTMQDRGFGIYTVTILPSDMEYNARFYPTQWNQILIYGGTPAVKIAKDGTLIENSGAFLKMRDLLSHPSTIKRAENGAAYNDIGIKEWLLNGLSDNPKLAYLKLKVNGKAGYYNNPNDPELLEVVKDKFVELLNLMGILFNLDELNYMLLHKYGSTDALALAQMFTSTSNEDSMSTFLYFLTNVSTNGKINNEIRISGKRKNIKDAYLEMAFVKELANWKYKYRHSRDLLTVLATNNNKYYEISDNNYVTDVVRFLNKRSEEFEEIKSDPYNYYKDDENKDALGNTPVYGSLILEEITNNPDIFVTLRSPVGFKTDKRGDLGSDYFLMSKREDYVMKASLLLLGKIIMPTLSDKKTWFYIDGISLPGINYSDPVIDLILVYKDPTSQYETMLTQDSVVIDRFISYAMSEYKSILKADADLDLMEKDGTKNSEVDNYYNKEQGAKFSSLLGVWVYEYKPAKDGSMLIVGETFKSFNDSKKSRKENIREAEKYFFNLKREELEVLIQRLLHKRFLKEVETCEKLGLILKIGNSDNIFVNYKNIGLDAEAIRFIYESLERLYIKNTKKQIDGIIKSRLSSLALMMYILDISNKAIMSVQEVERVFSGNPGYYSWKYDKNGNLIDRSVDEIKRLGGLISTGNNNFLELKDIPQKYVKDGKFTGTYVCAQVHNELIESPLISDIEELMYRGELYTTVYILRESREIEEFRNRINSIRSIIAQEKFDELSKEDLQFYKDNANNMSEAELRIRELVSQEIDSLSVEELELQLDDDVKTIVAQKAKEISDSYKLKYREDGSIDEGIDVADGSAYITDTMAEMLLRMNGNYSSDVENAFKILRGEKRSTILLKYDAYKLVLTSVIGSQKYTAFGRRTHAKTGVLVAYYNKMALFPLFLCMSTGRMQNVFNKMVELGVDMLMVDSAVKLGGQYSKSLDWDSFMQSEDESDPKNHMFEDPTAPLKPSFDQFTFGTYEQKFIYLRKQLNTDPKEDDFMDMGTQMTKIAMTNLFDGRIYYLRDGSTMTGKELRDDLMHAINVLSDRGRTSIEKRFFKTNNKGEFVDNDGNPINEGDKKVLDEAKFSKEVLRLLLTKDPDKGVLYALELEEYKDNKGRKQIRTKLPLNAISNSSWLESNIISAINDKVVDIEASGAAFILRSIWGMEGTALYERKKGNILGDEDLSPTINGGKRLQMINEEGSMDCVVSVDFIKKMFGGDLPRVPIKDKNRKVIWDRIPETDRNGNAIKDKDGNIVYAIKKDAEGNTITDDKGNPVYKRRIRTREMSFDELRSWLINRGIIGNNAHASIIGYRIPTLAQSSIHALRIVDILPVVNDTIILPAEFTKITGSDFDIDKLFLSSIQYKVNRTQTDDGKYHQTITSEFDESENAYYLNKILNDYITLLLDWKSHTDHTSRTCNILHKSIDNDTLLIKKVDNDLQEGVTQQKEEPYAFYSLSFLVESKDNYTTGKIGIGPFALNNNNHVLTMMYHVRFKHIESSIMSELGLESLDKHEDQNGLSIMSWLSAFINAHVDIAKDPYISRLNVNPFTYNIVNLLIRTGLGENTLYFVAQPIMREIATAYMNAGSMYMADPHESKYSLLQKAIDKVAEQWFKDSGITISGLSAMQLIEAMKEGGLNNKNIREKVNQKIKELFDTSIKLDAKGLTTLENLFLYYLAYLLFDKYAKALSSLVLYSKIDTKKHGKSVTEQLVYKDGFDRVYDISRDSNLFEESGLIAMKNDSYIGKKTANAIDTVLDILRDLFIQSSPAFLNATSAILQRIGRTDSLSATLVQKVANALSAAIKSKFFVDEYVPSITNNPNFIRDLVSDSTETVNIDVKQAGQELSISSDMHHKPSSYIGSTAKLIFVVNGLQYISNTTIIGANDDTNVIYIAHLIPRAISGRIVLERGRNTIQDRLNAILTKMAHDPMYSNLKDNYLLKMLVPAESIEYTGSNTLGELPDTYETMKFVKFFNFVDDGGDTSNYIIDAWQELLDYTNEDPIIQLTIRDFARDLIVYGFITSGDRGGFTKIFKYVPPEWRESSGYGDFIRSKLIEYLIGAELDIDLDDVILNNWFDNEFVRKYNLKDDKDNPQFVCYYTKENGVKMKFPTILAAIKNENGEYSASIDPDNAPLFIKVKRPNKRAYSSQRRFTIYKLHGIAISKQDVKYPVYVKVNPKGNQTLSNFLITEYGRSDAIYPQEYTINEEVLRSVYTAEDLGNYLNGLVKTEPEYSSIMEGLNRAYNRSDESSTGYLVNDEQLLQQNTQLATQSQPVFDVSKAEFYSGAATGADTVWGIEARALGIKVVDYTRDNWNALPQKWKDRLSSEYEQVATALNRPVIPPGSRGDIEVRRDMMLADKADAIFAIGHVVKPGQMGSKYINKSNHDVVDGGTGYAVQRGILRGIPVYVFDLSDNLWKMWDNNSNSFVIVPEPTLTHHAATIGTRGINDLGRLAIKNILANTMSMQSSILPAFTVPQHPVLSETEATINIYAGTNENADLSNFATRPFNYQNFHFDTVELAFLTAKFQALRLWLLLYGSKADQTQINKINEILDQLSNAKTGAEAKRIGGTKIKSRSKDVLELIDSFFGDLETSFAGIKEWNRTGVRMMREFLKASFEQNPQALQRLLATGNATLTHVQDKGKWGNEFPRLLMEVREELRQKTTSPELTNASLILRESLKDDNKKQFHEDC